LHIFSGIRLDAPRRRRRKLCVLCCWRILPMAESGETDSASKGEPGRKRQPSPPQQRLRRWLLCLQCAKCGGLCPAARVNPHFSPRSIVLSLLDNSWTSLLNADSPIWACCVCMSCDEFCPQDVKPHEVVAWLRNEAFRNQKAPQKISHLVASVRSSGASVALSRALLRRRQNLGLPQFSPAKPPPELFSGNES